MKNYLVLLMIISCFAVLISGCISSEEASKHYEADGLSFNYSETWVKADVQYPSNTTQSKILINLVDPSDPETGFSVQKHPMVTGNSLDSNMETVLESYGNSGYNILSKNQSSISGESAYELLYTVDKGNTHIKQREYWCKHNDSMYTVSFFSTPQNFDKSQNAFNIIMQSFKFV
nr:PsbP-related protein [uncultured Methanobacterium sp.]